MKVQKHSALLVFLLGWLFISSSVQGGNIDLTQRLYGKTAIANGAKIKVYDNTRQRVASTLYNKNYSAKVKLAYNRHNFTDIGPLSNSAYWCMTVTYTIAFYDDNYKLLTTVAGNKLKITNDGGSIYEAFHVFNQAEINAAGYAVLTVTDAVSNTCAAVAPEDIVLELTVQENSVLYMPASNGFVLENNNNTLLWSYCHGAESYDVEWVYYDEKSQAPLAANIFTDKEPVRINTKKQYYELNLTYPNGKVYYRVRGVGKYLSSTGESTDKYTDWVYPVSPFTTYLDLTSFFEKDKVWQYVTNYAEDAKYKKVITYYDGSFRNRQVQTNISSDTTLLVAETKYDHEGRGVATILPVPVKISNLSYQVDFNKFTGGKSDYDTDYDPAFGAAYNMQPALNASSAASQYYSNNNNVEKLNRDYIPDANGYAYMLTQYMEDGTGRVWRTSGVGEAFKLKKADLPNHYTTNVYGTPNETELRRLFGSNVGTISHYQKNAVVDPNGQVSVSYLDMHKRVIATALAGNTPSNLQSLPTNKSETITVSLDGTNAIDKNNFTSTSVNKIVNVVPNTSYNLKYSLTGVINQGSGFYGSCKTCKYDLVITVLNERGSNFCDPIVRKDIAPASYSCPADQSFSKLNLVDTTLQFPQVGSYTIYKKLILSSGNVEEILSNISTMEGFPDSSSYISLATQEVNVNMCGFTCADYPSNTNAECTNGLNYQYTCESLLSQMKEQISPDGYYYTDAVAMNDIRSRSITAGWSAAPSLTNLMDKDLFFANSTWADDLVKGHPEYCHYKACTTDVASRNYDLNMAAVPDWSTANTLGYLNPLSAVATVGRDPFFSGIGNAYKSAMAYEMNTYVYNKGLPATSTYLTLWDFVSNYNVYTSDTSYTPNDEEKWRLFHAIYLGLKQKYVKQWKHDASPSCDYLHQPYAVLEDPTDNLIDDIDDLEDKVIANLSESCGTPTQCNQNVKTWMRMLEAKCNPDDETDNITGSDSVAVAGYLYTYCSHTPCAVTNSPFVRLNPFNLLLREDLNDPSTYPELLSANLILQTHGCDLDNIAVDNPYIQTCYFIPNYNNSQGRVLDPENNVISPLNINGKTKCYVTGIKQCPDDDYSPAIAATGTCPDNTINPGITSCTHDIINGINKLLTAKRMSTYDQTGCYSTPGLWAPGKTVYANSAVQMILALENNCTGTDQGSYVLLTDKPSTTLSSEEVYAGFSIFAANASAQFAAASYCTPYSSYYNMLGLTPALDQNVTFYILDGTGSPVYIPRTNMISLGSPYVDCVYHKTYGEGMNVKNSFGIAVDIQVNNFNGVSGIRTVKAYLKSSLFNHDDSRITWKTVEAQPTFCSPTFTINPNQVKEDCIKRQIAIGRANGLLLWEKAVEQFKSEVLSKYYNNCFATPFDEKMNYSYRSNEYHYTLYYYDQAGNLVQTVPPAGVNPLKSTAFNSEGKYIAGNEPVHHLITRYRYNTLEQLTWQYTPDADSSYFFYDGKGQLRMSQNAKQRLASSSNNNKYSYTMYDAQGRITQVGQLDNYVSAITYMANRNNWKTITEMLNTYGTPISGSYTTSDVTMTAYDYGGLNEQENLRGRVSAVGVFSTGTSTTPDAVTYYSYDVHGNVKKLTQLISGFQDKTVDYEYDLISGKVNKVHYQKGQADYFAHQYRYDADNRITSVYTSSDNANWIEEARYFYYKHGPLARVELGRDKVQGLDYYYTLQGWLKGVNTPAPRRQDTNSQWHVTNDPGHDGISLNGATPYQAGRPAIASRNLHRFVAQDELAFSLGYYDGDHVSIGAYGTKGLGANSIFSATYASDGILADIAGTKGLFNGNIAMMTTQVHSLGTLKAQNENFGIRANAYQYDQLNRLKEARSISYNNTGTAGWMSRSNVINAAGFDSYYSYDANGNIQRAKINGATASLMDDLTYQYDEFQDGSDPWYRSNRLYHVNDAVGASTGTDLGDQGSFTASATSPYHLSPSPGVINTANNYRYDAIGNLVHDEKEEIETIEWNVYGKVKTVIRKAGSTKAKLEFLYDGAGNRVMKKVTPTGGGAVLTTYYVRDASGNVMASYETSLSSYNLEYPIYGSSRLGLYRRSSAPVARAAAGPYTANTYEYQPTQREYELSNHLGNVYLVVSGMKYGKDTTADGRSDYYVADIKSASDYYAFGSTISSRSYSSSSYRYGFNGKENDPESGWQDYGMRMYNTRLARFFSVDPLFRNYPHLTPYQFASDCPIESIDMDGGEQKSSKTLIPLGRELKTAKLTVVGIYQVGQTVMLNGMNYRVVSVTPSSTAFSKFWGTDNKSHLIQYPSSGNTSVTRVYNDLLTQEDQSTVRSVGPDRMMGGKRPYYDMYLQNVKGYEVSLKEEVYKKYQITNANSISNNGTFSFIAGQATINSEYSIKELNGIVDQLKSNSGLTANITVNLSNAELNNTDMTSAQKDQLLSDRATYISNFFKGKGVSNVNVNQATGTSVGSGSVGSYNVSGTSNTTTTETSTTEIY